MILILCAFITTDERNVLCAYECCILCSVTTLTDCTCGKIILCVYCNCIVTCSVS
jgi:hypothetical protein